MQKSNFQMCFSSIYYIFGKAKKRKMARLKMFPCSDLSALTQTIYKKYMSKIIYQIHRKHSRRFQQANQFKTGCRICSQPTESH